jgi:hypothetical protein
MVTIPEVGPITSRAFRVTVTTPARFYGESERAFFFLDVRNVPWDGSTGFEDVRAGGFLRPPWAMANDSLFTLSWADGAGRLRLRASVLAPPVDVHRKSHDLRLLQTRAEARRVPGRHRVSRPSARPDEAVPTCENYLGNKRSGVQPATGVVKS